ncbi:MAG: LexA family protein [Henriciella sp.]
MAGNYDCEINTCERIMSLAERLQRSLTRKKVSPRKASLAVGASSNFIYDILNDKVKSPRADTLAELAGYLDVSLTWLLTGRMGSGESPGVRVVGKAEAGAWREINNFEETTEYTPIAPVAAYPAEAQFAVEVAGESVNNFCSSGGWVICVRPDAYLPNGADEQKALNNKFVVVERINADGLVETTIKKYVVNGESIELRPDSNDPRHQKPVRYDEKNGATVQISGVVILKLEPAP